MRQVLKLTEHLFVDLSTGSCSCSQSKGMDSRTDRLTKGQLKILNYMVKNRGLLCTHSKLEGLFDSDMKEDVIPGIKQQIWRIKIKLKKVDHQFSGEFAKQIFQSVSGRGYIFCLPDQGEVIREKLPCDKVIMINWRLVSKYKINSDIEKENLKFVFYSIAPDNHTIFRAVCNQLHVCNSEYKKLMEELIKYLLHPSPIFSPVFLMGAEGIGKLTLLCALAVQMSLQFSNWNIYYIDFGNIDCTKEDDFQCIMECIDENGISRVRKNVLCIDNPSANPIGFQKLYRLLRQKKSPYLYLLAADRAFYIFRLLEDNTVYQENSFNRSVYLEHGVCMRKKKIHFPFSKFQFIYQSIQLSPIFKALWHLKIRYMYPFPLFLPL